MPGRPPAEPAVPFLDSMFEGPTVRLEPTPPQTRPPRGRRLAVVAVLAAVLALSAATFSAYLGWRALDRADGARELAAHEAPASQVTASPPVSPAPPPGDASVLLGGPPGGSAAPAGPGWAVRYTGKVLTVRAGCSAHVFLDLDEPRVEVAGPGTDVHARCAGSGTHLTLGPGAEAAAELRSAGIGAAAEPTPEQVGPTGSTPARPAPDAKPTATPESADPPAVPGSTGPTSPPEAAEATACEQRLRTGPLPDGAAAVVATGLVLCVRTAPTGTGPATLVRLEVVSVDAERTTLRATAWTPV